MSKKDYNFIDQKELAEKMSHKPELELYINNLDKVLGIKTINICKSIGGIRFNIECKTFVCEGCNQNPKITKELILDNKSKKLYINDRDYDWYIINKDIAYPIFTIKGLEKKGSKIVSYILERKIKSTKLTKVTEENF